jgi:hypothetical protein
MKKIITTIYEGLMGWATMLAEFRQSKTSKYYY